VRLLPMQSPHSFLFVFFSFSWGWPYSWAHEGRGARYKVGWEDDDASMQWLQTLQSKSITCSSTLHTWPRPKLHSGPIPRSLIKANAKLDQRIANQVWNRMHHPPFARLTFVFDHFWGVGLRMRR
jgi:hypothetical protein